MSDYYIKVYPSFAQKYHLSSNDLLIFSLICGFSENGKRFFGTQRYIAEQLNISRQTVNESLGRLVKQGVIEKQKSGKQIVFTVNIPLPSDTNGDSALSGKPTRAVKNTDRDYTNHHQYKKQYIKRDAPSFDLSREKDFLY